MLVMFAGNTNLFTSGSNILNLLKKKMNKELTNRSFWFKANKLSPVFPQVFFVPRCKKEKIM